MTPESRSGKGSEHWFLEPEAPRENPTTLWPPCSEEAQAS